MSAPSERTASRPAGADIEPEQVAALVRRAGRGVLDFYRAGRRTALTSPLFNVRGRLLVGSECYFRHLPWILREVCQTCSPEEAGRRMAGLCRRPNGGGLIGVAHSYLNGREQRRLSAGIEPGVRLPEEDFADLALVMDFWDRASRAYYGTDAYLPHESGNRMQVLRAEQVDEVAARTRGEVPDDRRRAIRRTMAIAELYTFIANGESRVGVYHHGPYPVDEGETIVVKELVGMRDRTISWDAPLPPVDAVARIMRLRDVEAGMDLFGSLMTDPPEYEGRILGEDVVTVDDGGIRSLSPDEITELEAVTSSAQLMMYEQAAEWDEVRQVAYGGELYAFLATPWFAIAGIRGEDRVIEAFRATAHELAPRIAAEEEISLLHQRMATTEELFESASIASG